tara:strand:- start:2416 stop:3273 length:858 start_codon:yes stop_codon:yes gene_type:complete
MISNITIVLISHKSKEKVLKFIENFSNQVNIIIVENSQDKTIQKELTSLNKNTKLVFSENNGYGSGINLARKFINTDYFAVFNPDVNDINEKVLEKFFEAGKKLNDKFACIGPRYLNISKKTLTQSNKNKEIDILASISGAAMYFNKKNFDLINGFDENFFLYFEETDFCLRAKKKGFKSFQVNTIGVNHDVGTSAVINSEKEKIKLKYLHNWHFIWSKFYFYKKHHGFLFSFILFLPLLLRTKIKINFYKFLSKNEIKKKYQIRYDGLITSIKGLKSSKRVKDF